MKNTIKLLGALLVAASTVTSCVDDSLLPYDVPAKPGNLEDYEYLKEYDVLKSYLSRETHPDFKVSAAVEAGDFTSGSAVTRIVSTNFDEVVAGNAFKMASVVNDKGEFNYGTVQSFVSNAENNGLTVYGHTLAWHSQQPVKWLSKLIADKPKPVTPGQMVESNVTDYEINYSNESAYSFWGAGASEVKIEDGALQITNGAIQPNFWDTQYQVASGVPTTTGNSYLVTIEAKAIGEGTANVRYKLGDWSDGITGSFELEAGADYKEIEFAGNATCDGSFLLIQFGDFVGTVLVKSVKVQHVEMVEGPSTVEKEVKDFSIDCGTVSGLSWNGCPDGVKIEYGKEGCLVFSNTEAIDPWYAFQYWIVNGINLTEGQEYTVTVNCRLESENNGAINVKIGDWGGGFDKSNLAITANEDFADYTFKGSATMASNGIFMQHADGFIGTLYLKSVTISHIEVQQNSNSAVEYKEVWTNHIVNSEMADGGSMKSFIVRDNTKTDEPADVIVGGGPDGMNCLKISGKTSTTNPWDTQFFIYTPDKKWEAGETYKLHMWYKASKAIGTDSQIHSTPGAYVHWQMLSPNPSFTTEWKEQTWEGKIPSEGGGNQQSIAFNLNKNRTADDGVAENVDQIDYYFAGITWESCQMVEVPKTEEKVINKRVIIVETDDKVDAEWDSQFWIQTNEPFHAGDKYEFKAEVRAAKAASPGTQIHKGSAGGYIHWQAIGNTSFSTDWETVTATGTIPAEGDGGDFIAWNLNDFADANTYMFGSISFKINGVEMLNNTDLKSDDNSSFWKKEKRGATINAPISDGYTVIEEIKSTIPLTPEEKRDTLIYAMQKWIYGMMEATEGKVKSWDLINEAVSGGGNVEGHYDLQHFDGYQSGTWDVGGDAFYWQDYLGAENYGVVVDSIARNAYAQVEGANPADLKLFVNDYNLESTWDDNKKLESLIYWIGVWERGGAKIDGIGTQMHISYYLNKEDQDKQKEHITTMFKAMAATGKLVRVSELDMGVAEKMFGPAITSTELAKREDGLAIEKAMADYYQWIIEEYFKWVPEKQQYGICQWCLTDSPKGSGWRPDEPVGLWYQDYTRKPAYAGWAEGLKNAK